MGRRNATTTWRKTASWLFFFGGLGVFIAISNLAAIPWRCHVDSPPSSPLLSISDTSTETIAPKTTFHFLPLPRITNGNASTTTTSCDEEFVWISNQVVNENLRQYNQKPSKIPRIIHQTSKSRCVTKKVARAIHKWQQQFPEWNYFFHDDEAVRKLLHTDFPEFPHLGIVSQNCLMHGTVTADLWRYLVLWVYGGIYADIDAVPARFASDTLSIQDDAFFVVEQYHLLSQYFMALSPRHPLMYYAIQKCLVNLLGATDTGSIRTALMTGPHALHAAYMQFRKDAGDIIEAAIPGNKPVVAGHFMGTFNRSVTVVGIAEMQNEYINRDILGRAKIKEYKRMEMRHFQQDVKHPSGTSCMTAILRTIKNTQ